MCCLERSDSINVGEEIQRSDRQNGPAKDVNTSRR
jgi:hypothetical protein